MKKIYTLLFFSQIFFLSLLAQSSEVPAMDKSVMDMSYFPSNYPVLKIQGKITGSPVARIIYSRPQKAGRQIFGGLVKYNERWRLGANEATEIEFFKNVTIGGKKVGKGRYTMSTIPTEDSWTIVLNKETDTWGVFKYDTSKDFLKTVVPVENIGETIEYLSIYFQKAENGCNLIMSWENIKVSLPISY